MSFSFENPFRIFIFISFYKYIIPFLFHIVNCFLYGATLSGRSPNIFCKNAKHFCKNKIRFLQNLQIYLQFAKIVRYKIDCCKSNKNCKLQKLIVANLQKCCKNYCKYLVFCKNFCTMIGRTIPIFANFAKIHCKHLQFFHLKSNSFI